MVSYISNMGQLLKAHCTCGFTSENLMAGPGLATLETSKAYRLVYCDHCENVQSTTSNDNNPQCETCGHTLSFYEGPVQRRSLFPSFDYTKGRHHCPGCKTHHLRFIVTGLWD